MSKPYIVQIALDNKTAGVVYALTSSGEIYQRKQINFGSAMASERIDLPAGVAVKRDEVGEDQ